jgi:hypothetical protein
LHGRRRRSREIRTRHWRLVSDLLGLGRCGYLVRKPCGTRGRLSELPGICRLPRRRHIGILRRHRIRFGGILWRRELRRLVSRALLRSRHVDAAKTRLARLARSGLPVFRRTQSGIALDGLRRLRRMLASEKIPSSLVRSVVPPIRRSVRPSIGKPNLTGVLAAVRIEGVAGGWIG